MSNITEKTYLLNNKNNESINYSYEHIKDLLFMMKLEFEAKYPQLNRLFNMAYEKQAPLRQYTNLKNIIFALERNPKQEERIKGVLLGMCFVNHYKGTED